MEGDPSLLELNPAWDTAPLGCTACGKEWPGVFPTLTVAPFECPNCHKKQGWCIGERYRTVRVPHGWVVKNVRKKEFLLPDDRLTEDLDRARVFDVMEEARDYAGWWVDRTFEERRFMPGRRLQLGHA